MNHLSFLSKITGQNILFAPLNWGLGHATRSAVLIDYLQKHNQVHIASDGLALEWLTNRYPKSVVTQLPSYVITYTSKHMWWNMLRSGPGILLSIHAENKLIKRYVKEKKIDLIVSDHRFGCYSDLCKSVVVAHQINIPHSNIILAKWATTINKNFLRKFDEIWIPDSTNKLSGILSDPRNLSNVKEIGYLSLMKKFSSPQRHNDILILLSGPEPSRTQLEKKICSALNKIENRTKILVRGTHLNRLHDKTIYDQFSQVIDLADSNVVNHLLESSRCIICRSGYSTIMDLHALQCKAILIPTPRQPEQEYLAKKHESQGHIRIIEKDVIHQLPDAYNKVVKLRAEDHSPLVHKSMSVH